MENYMDNVPAEFQDLVEKPQEESKQSPVAVDSEGIPVEFQGLVENDTVSSKQNGIAPDVSIAKDYMPDIEAYAEQYNNYYSPTEIEKRKRGSIYRTYLATKPEILEQAKVISSHIKVPVSAIISKPENFNAAVKKDERYRKLLALAPTGEKNFVLDDLYAEYPDLEKFKDSTDGAIALHNIKNVKVTHGIINSGVHGWESRKLVREAGEIKYNDFMGKKITEADRQKLADLNVKQATMLRYAPDFLADPFSAIAYGTVEQGAMMAEQGLKANLYAIPMAGLVGIGTGAVTKNPAAAGAAFKSAYASMMKLGYGVEMFKETVGNYYYDYKEHRNKDGQQLLTDDEARLAATVAAAGEAYIEVGNWNTVLDVLKGGPKAAEAKEVLEGIVANAADKASFKAQLAYYLKNRFGKAVGAGWSEIKEEGKQSLYTDTVHNVVAYLKPGGDLKKIDASDMAANAWDEMWAAAPSVIGMTGAGHIAGSSKYVNKLADWLMAKHEDVLTAQKTAGGINMLEQLAADVKNSDLAKNSRDVYDQLVTNSLEGTQYENVVVDTDLLLEDENNEENNQIFYQLATAAGKTKTEADEVKENRSSLSVPVAKYLEVIENDTVREKLSKVISFDVNDQCFARIQKRAKEMSREFNKKIADDYNKIASTIENWVQVNVEGEQEQAIMTQVLFEYMDAKEGVKAVRQQYEEELDGLLKNTLNNMRSGMKQGVSFLFTDDDGYTLAAGQGQDVHIGGATRISNNDRWHSEYYKENKKAPSEKEMKRLARKALTGKNPYGIITDNFGLTGADLGEAENWYKQRFEQIDNILTSVERLEPLAASFDTSELKLLEGLSKEGIQAYNAARDYLLKANGNVRKAAAASAIVVAHHADVWAGYMRQMGHNVTAMDHVNKRLGWGDGNIGAGGLNQQQAVHIGTELTIQRPIEEVKVAYEEFNSLPNIEAVFKEIDAEADINEKRFKARKYFDNKYKDVNKNPVLLKNRYGDKIKVVTGTFKEIKGHSGNEDVLSIIPYIQELLDTSVFLYANKSNVNRAKKMASHIKEYRTYGNKMKVGDNEYYVKVVIRLEDSGVLVLHDIDLNKKTKVKSESSRSDEYESPLELKDSTFVVNNIPWWLEEVKKNLYGTTYFQKNQGAKADIHSDSFKAWFGDWENGEVPKELLDENGEPRVFYRGLAEKYDLNKQKAVVWVTENQEQADDYRKAAAGSEVLPLFVKFRNPLYIGNAGTMMTLSSFIKNVMYPANDKAFVENRVSREQGMSIIDRLDELFKKDDGKYWTRYEIYNNNPELFEILKELGYDAVATEENGNMTYGVFGQENVKSAIANNGNFDINNSNVYMQIASTVDNYNQYNQQQAINPVIQEQMEAVRQKYKGTDQWMKDYDGNDTQLTENQWLLIRTDYFREKYGYNKKTAEIKKLQEMEPVVAKQGEIKKTETLRVMDAAFAWAEANGLYGDVDTEIGKVTIDQTSIKTSFNHGIYARKLDAVTTLKEGLKQAAYIGMLKDFDGQPIDNHYFVYKMQDGDNEALVFCRARKDANKTRLYIHAVYDEEQIKNIPVKTAAKFLNSKPHGGDALFVNILSQFLNSDNPLNVPFLDNGEPNFTQLDENEIYMQNASVADNFNQWFASSKVVDADGNPKVMYHGTGTDGITEFKHSKAQDKMGRAMAMGQGKGKFYFATTEGAANIAAQGAVYRGQGKNAQVMPVYLKIENPINLDTYKQRYQEMSGHDLNEGYSDSYTMKDRDRYIAKLDKQLRKEGVDGIYDEGYGFAAVFEPTQIKSAVANNGNFDINNPNIYMQRAWHGTGAVFDNWDLGYAGSGEGGAAHGWGLYFAADRKTAQGYRDMLTGGIDYTYKGKPINKLREQIERKGDYAKLEVLDNFLIHEDVNEIAKSDDYDPKAKKWFVEKVAPYISGKGSLFEVEVPENNEMLDEGKPFTEHSKVVQDNVKKLVAGLSEEQKALFKAPYLDSIRKETASREILALDKDKKDYERMAAWLDKLEEPPTKGLLYHVYLSTLEDLQKEGYDIDALKTSAEARNKAKADFEAKAAEVQAKIDADEARREADYQSRKEAAEKNDIETVLNTMTGADIYNGLRSVYGNQKDASLALNKAGVKGIAYDGGRDGRCFVVFSEDAVGTIERYNQAAGKSAETANIKAIVDFGGNVVAGSALNQQAARVQGATEITAVGQHIIHIMETADQSTFMHEMAHVFYDDLHDLAMDENAPEQVKKDWQNLEKWTAWKEGQLEEYKGTASYSDFKDIDAAIRQAQETGKGVYQNKEWTLQSLLNRWAQERFARGFEVYLEEGKAPTKTLQSVFAKFKKWLTNIYKAVTGAGAKPSAEVKEIMDRMIATQEEIDSAIEAAKIEALEKQGLFRYLNGTSQDMWQRNIEKIREDVAARIQKIAFRDLTAKAKDELEEKLKQERAAAYERISQEPVFVAYQFLQKNRQLSVSDVVESCTDMTVEQYVSELKARGGSLDAAVDKYMETYEANLEKPTKEEIKSAAKEAVSNSYYTKLATAFEVEALEQYARDEERLAKKLANIKTRDEKERKKEEAAIRELDKKQRLQEERDRRVRTLAQEQKRNEKLEKDIRELDARILSLKSQIHAIKAVNMRNRDMRLQEVRDQMQNKIFEAVEELEAKKKELKEERLKYNKWRTDEGRGKRIYRDSLRNYVERIEEYAKKKMAALPISDATNAAMWKRMAENYSDSSLELFAQGEYDLAAKQKRIAFFYQHMAQLAENNKAKVDSKVKTLIGHSRTMIKEKHVAANDRYLYNHLMYCFGMANKDALKPPQYTSYKDVLPTYNENLELRYIDQDGNIDLPDWLTGAMATDAVYKDGYTSLNMEQLQLLFNVMQNIYKAGRDAKNLKTARDTHGNIQTVESAVSEIIVEATGNVAVKPVRDETGAEDLTDVEKLCLAGNKIYVSLLKPETILRQLGDKAMDYLYNPIKLASDKEMAETESLAAKVRDITAAYEDGLLEVYSNMSPEQRNGLSPEQATMKALKELRSKKVYKLGDSNLTKENVIALALNWGTELNRKRILDGFNVQAGAVLKLLAELNSADWQMVINIWELFDEYWPRLIEVEANCSGVVLEKQEAVPFTVVDKNGIAFTLKGGYYPIKYDLDKNPDLGNKAKDDALRMQMSDQSRLAMGLGNTKERQDFVYKKLRLDFGYSMSL